jgi:phosphatidylglycerol---prolipoprotein diacylglyceryl transferase
MEFPAWIALGPVRLHPHPVLEGLGYLLGYRLYVHLRHVRGDPLSDLTRLSTVAAAAVGALVGSKLLALLEHPVDTFQHLGELAFLIGGKSVVGALLGGLIAVELTKKRLGVRTATGDLYALPLILGIAIGRLGCFLTGLSDGTHGNPTTLPWGVDFGDGQARHPTQLYEIAFLILLALAVLWRQRAPGRPGDLFKLFMVGYLLWRLAVEFIKPDPPLVMGLTAIQIACVAGLVYYAPAMPRLLRWREAG